MRFDKSLFREAFLTIDIRTVGLAPTGDTRMAFEMAKRR